MLKKMDSYAFDQVYALMEKSFPREERRSYIEQKKLLENPCYQIYAADQNAEIGMTGFIAAWDLKEILYIEHFAVEPALRGGGIGSAMLNELTEDGKRRVCLEVEPPDTEEAKRRIAFYERNGFFLNAHPYMQPSLGEGRPSIPLLIMTSVKAVEEAEFLHIRDLLYRKVYHKI